MQNDPQSSLQHTACGEDLNGAVAPAGFRPQAAFAEIPVGTLPLYFTVNEGGAGVTLRHRDAAIAPRTWFLGTGGEEQGTFNLGSVQVAVFKTKSTISFDFNSHPLLTRIPLLNLALDSQYYMSFAATQHPDARMVLYERGCEPWPVRPGFAVGKVPPPAA